MGQSEIGLRIDQHGVCLVIEAPKHRPPNPRRNAVSWLHPELPYHPLPVRPATPSLSLPFSGYPGLLLNWFGIDRPIAYAIASHVWRVIAGPVGLFLVATFLTRIEQGYYYTFVSILGLAVFFDLGLEYVIVQFTSHEMAGLKWSPQGKLEGDPVAKARLAGIFRLSLKWYGVASLLTIALVGPVGFWFFAQRSAQHPEVLWQTPWVWAVVTAGIGLCTSPVLAVLEGTGLVAEVGRLRFIQAIAGNLMLWLALCARWALIAIPLVSTTSLVLAGVWLLSAKRQALADLLSFSHHAASFSWRSELLPMQWKIAVAYLSNYFVFQVGTPVLFTYQSPAAAGRMGLSLSIMLAVLAVGGAWINTKGPRFGTLIARRDFQQLDALFHRALRQSFGVVFLGGLLLWIAVLVLNLAGHRLSERILAPAPFALLVIALLAYHVFDCEAIYLHAHKQDPFLPISLVAAPILGVSTYFLGRFYGAAGIIAGWAILVPLVYLGWGTWIFTRKRRDWHRECRNNG